MLEPTQALQILESQPRDETRVLRLVRDYDVPNVSELATPYPFLFRTGLTCRCSHSSPHRASESGG
jgi:hypothetical protein